MKYTSWSLPFVPYCFSLRPRRLVYRFRDVVALGEAAVSSDEDLSVATYNKSAGWHPKAPNDALVVNGSYRCQRGGGEPRASYSL